MAENQQNGEGKRKCYLGSKERAILNAEVSLSVHTKQSCLSILKRLHFKRLAGDSQELYDEDKMPLIVREGGGK